MQYIFDFDTVEALADFEIAVYRVFPDIEEMEKKFKTLKKQLHYLELDDDEDLNKSLDKFEELLKESEVYYEAKSFREVIDNEDHEKR